MLGISEASPVLAIEGLKTEIQAIDAMVAEALAQMKVDSLPSAEDIAGRQDGLRLNREEARRQRQALDGCLLYTSRCV